MNTGNLSIEYMNIKEMITDWIETGNRYDTAGYLEFYWPDAILDDAAVGSIFKGHAGIKSYFVDYFIGYQTQTTIVSLIIADETHAHLEVAFTGTFPGGHINGTFDFTFRDHKIAFVKADLIW